MISGSIGCLLILFFLVYCALEDLRAMSVSVLAYLVMAASELGWYFLRLIRGEWRLRTEDRLFIAACALIPALCIVIIFLLRGIDLMEKENSAFPVK